MAAPFVGQGVASAAPVTAVTFTPGSNLANATSTWTVGLTSSAGGALAAPNTISVQFGPGFILPPTPTVTFASGFTGTCAAGNGATLGQVITITLTSSCVLANSTAATVTIAGVTNPGAGSYPGGGFGVATTKDSIAPPAGSIVIAPTAVTGVTFAPASSAPSANTTYTVGFTTSASGALSTGNTITVAFAAGFTVPASPPVTFASGFTGVCTGTTTGVKAGQSVVITLSGTCALGNSTAASVTIGTITNNVAGSYAASTFSVATSQDITPAHPTLPVVIGSSPSAVTFTPGSNLTGALSTWTIGFTTSATGALASTNTISVTFAAGFGLPASPTVATGTGFTGTCTGTTASTTGQVVKLTLAGAGCALAASTAGTVTIAGITNPAAATYPANAFSVATSQDPAPANPASAVVINAVANTPTGVTFMPGVAVG
ncbi:MAG TPA: hypothetical protein VGG43_11020, partial [Acidimicrobiales bacterium]